MAYSMSGARLTDVLQDVEFTGTPLQGNLGAAPSGTGNSPILTVHGSNGPGIA